MTNGVSAENYDPMNPATWLVRLPTEYEWEKAARGTDGRIYPDEGDFDAQKGNTDETGLRQTSAVGIFPAGASPYGLMDMSGNVWEWCLTEHSNPQQKAEVENISSNSLRVLRGGSWFSLDNVARAVYRCGAIRTIVTTISVFVCVSPFSKVFLNPVGRCGAIDPARSALKKF